MKKILVTGATSYVGTHCIAELIARGYAVRGTVRKLDKGQAVTEAIERHLGKEPDIEYVETDLMSDRNWDEAMKGVDAVLHVASPFPMQQPEDPKEVTEPAVQGTIRALKAANDNGVKRVVLTASVASIIYGHPARQERPFNEEDWTNPDGRDVTPYVLSKYLAEKAAWKFADENNMQITTIHPGLILGPLLRKEAGTSVDVIRKFLHGEMPGSPKVQFPIVDVRDVARLHVDALESQQAIGQRYLATSEAFWFHEIGAALKTAVPEFSRKLPKFVMPNWLVKLVSVFDKDVSAIVPQLGKEMATDNSKTRNTFDWQPVAAIESIAATAESLKEHNIV